MSTEKPTKNGHEGELQSYPDLSTRAITSR